MSRNGRETLPFLFRVSTGSAACVGVQVGLEIGLEKKPPSTHRQPTKPPSTSKGLTAPDLFLVQPRLHVGVSKQNTRQGGLRLGQNRRVARFSKLRRHGGKGSVKHQKQQRNAPPPHGDRCSPNPRQLCLRRAEHGRPCTLKKLFAGKNAI